MLRSLDLAEIPPEIPNPPARPPKEVPVTRMEPPVVYVAPAWEYRHLSRPAAEPPDERELDALGADGWELAGVSTDGGIVHFYFKRQVR